MALAIIGFIFLVVILLLVFLDIEGLRRKEERLEEEPRELEIRLRDVERYYICSTLDRNQPGKDRISAHIKGWYDSTSD